MVITQPLIWGVTCSDLQSSLYGVKELKGGFVGNKETSYQVLVINCAVMMAESGWQPKEALRCGLRGSQILDRNN